MNVRAFRSKKRVRQSLLWLMGFARIILALFAIGNLGFLLSAAIAQKYITGPYSIHADFLQYWIRAVFSCVVVAALFPFVLKEALGSFREGVALGTVLAIVCIVLQVSIALAMGSVPSATWALSQTQIVYTVGYAIAAAITEELLCRFVLLAKARELIGTVAAFACQFIVFVYIHISILAGGQHYLALIATGGLVLGAVYLYSNSLYAPVSFHIVYNILVVFTFGGAFDGTQIYPLLALDNVANHWTSNAAAIFNATVTVVIILKIRMARIDQLSNSGRIIQ